MLRSTCVWPMSVYAHVCTCTNTQRSTVNITLLLSTCVWSVCVCTCVHYPMNDKDTRRRAHILKYYNFKQIALTYVYIPRILTILTTSQIFIIRDFFILFKNFRAKGHPVLWWDISPPCEVVLWPPCATVGYQSTV